MSKDYQKKNASTSTTEVSPRPVTMPDMVTVAMSEIAADVHEGLLALAVGAHSVGSCRSMSGQLGDDRSERINGVRADDDI